jgi:hypothetical protein
MKTIIANKWWGFEEGRKNMHWRSWDSMLAPKFLGGLGFKDFVLFNQAILVKQCCRMLTEPTSLYARVLKRWHFPNSDFLSAGKLRSSSFTRWSILSWGVGDGKKIKIMSDNWIQACLQLLSPLWKFYQGMLQ